ncbi:MAG: hypothetical protein IKL84_05775, partial [Clostridia bacterium]|nr:hypothetical protein [Clostridia bacterium]
MTKRNWGRKLLSAALALLTLLLCLPQTAPVHAAAQTYIESVAVGYHRSSGSIAKNHLTSEGYTVIDYDLNKGCGSGSAYIYMGYTTTTDPSKAITGVYFALTDTDETPAESVIFDGVTAYLLGGSTEPNPAENDYVDLNVRAKGDYIYTYVTRDKSRQPITEIVFDESTSKTNYTTPAGNLNNRTSGDPIYMHYRQYCPAKVTHYYLKANGARTSYVQSPVGGTPSESLTVSSVTCPNTVTYEGRTLTFKGWRADEKAQSGFVTPATTVTFATSPLTYYAVYGEEITLTYSAEGCGNVPAAQKGTKYYNTGSGNVTTQNANITIASTVPTNAAKCQYLGWAADANAAEPAYLAGKSYSFAESGTLYPVWTEHNYVNGICSACKGVDGSNEYAAEVRKNGELKGLFTDLEEAFSAAGEEKDGQIAVNLLTDYDSEGYTVEISSGTFTLNFNG